MNGAVALDHVGVVGRDVAVLAAEFERCGFCLTPLARHQGGRTGNRTVMLRQGYLELLSVVDGGHSATLDRFLARHAGLHILAFAIDDPDAALARLHRAGFAQAARSETQRAVDDADPDGEHARFTLVTTPDPPEGRIHLVQHHTPAALWQDRFLHHPNHATALAEVVVATATPAESAARLARLAGRPLVPDPAGGYRLELASGAVRLMPPAAVATVLPGASVPALPCLAGVTLRTDDATASLRRWLQDRAIDFGLAGDAVLVTAGSAALRFV